MRLNSLIHFLQHNKIQLLLVAVFCATNATANVTLSNEVCKGFLYEAQQLERAGSSEKGAPSYGRFQRLEERLRLFCPDISYQALSKNVSKNKAKSDNKPILQVAAIDLKQGIEPYESTKKQQAWLAFYRATERCTKMRKTTQEHVYCTEEISKQKRLFDLHWEGLEQSKERDVAALKKVEPKKHVVTNHSVEQKINPSTQDTNSSHVKPNTTNSRDQYKQSPQQASTWLFIGRYIWLILLITSIVVVTVTLWPYTRRILNNQISRLFLSTFLSKSLPKTDYYLAGKIHFVSDGKTHHIDQLILSKFGVFVVQYQTQCGSIWQDTHSELWTQSVDDERYYFDNPIVDLDKKVAFLKDLLDIEGHVQGCIIFPNDVSFRTTVPSQVCLYDQAPSYIKQIDTPYFELQRLEALKEQIKLYQKDTSFTERFSQLVTQGP
ncbi:hypothetical protein PSECIP111951_00183 [Pseudoalteromonas holothuriae]|uniref:NERD domain-containing protein n=1 Tax=Pseudoalteromonas holothuriae TaxID=2963714 RepID=A0A9W4VSH9_9GAMM|nr:MULTISPECIES: nuclease-related domain-containing protein [unclassified Pseudoalteromonas]CAH9050394.1 hypothetical protein PSECIP111951_00183 [Pseudoalteromonas sp. CIP111951]CAH9052292.1 hypothetical protein PSECIP111854_00937 [Pseudoalteromonas sp. CIP111854]